MWECYELRFKAKSPIHIGYGSKLGVINRTRYYIPGKTIWGAVTAILTRKIMAITKEDYKAKFYINVGEFIQKNMIFSYFYPSNGENVFYPNYTKKGFGFGGNKDFISKEGFERNFISSYVSTAICKTSKTAEDESLHEFEVITTKSPNKSLEFMGYLFINKDEVNRDNESDLSIENLKKDEIILKKENKTLNLFESIKKLQVGGERNYGLGWLELQQHIKKDEIDLYESGVHVDLEDLNISSDDHIALAHVKLNSRLNNVKGDLEPLIGREWNYKKGPGQNLTNAKICLTPGTRFESKLKISDFGVWEYSV